MYKRNFLESSVREDLDSDSICQISEKEEHK
jgi:hypothetical protein